MTSFAQKSTKFAPPPCKYIIYGPFVCGRLRVPYQDRSVIKTGYIIKT